MADALIDEPVKRPTEPRMTPKELENALKVLDKRSRRGSKDPKSEVRAAFHIGEELDKEITPRMRLGDTKGETSKRNLARYFYALKQAREVVASKKFSHADYELMYRFILERNYGPVKFGETAEPIASIRIFWLDIEARGGAPSLVNKLKSLTATQTLALIDALEQLKNQEIALKELEESHLKAVGLISP
jgi:hypothetical protein